MRTQDRLEARLRNQEAQAFLPCLFLLLCLYGTWALGDLLWISIRDHIPQLAVVVAFFLASVIAGDICIGRRIFRSYRQRRNSERRLMARRESEE